MNASTNGNNTTMTVARDLPDMSVIERVLVDGDLQALTPDQRVTYYNKTCESLGLNSLTKPFAYIKLNGKLVMYALRDCTDQLRKIHGISITIVGRENMGGAYVVTARATTPDGRCDESMGAVPMPEGLQGENLANALMKCETKAKRRVTLSIVGLGMLDESEVNSIKGAKVITDDGEVVEQPVAAAVPEAPISDTSLRLSQEVGALVDASPTLESLMQNYNAVIASGLPEAIQEALIKRCTARKKELAKAAKP